MKIVIPMAGSGQRFVDAGYTDPKPLIRLGDGRRIVEHVLDMFTEPADEFVFVCNENHIRDTNLKSILSKLKPNSNFTFMPAHELGPVWTVMAAKDCIKDDEEVIVAYCDGTLKWDRAMFGWYVKSKQLDGCILTHTGFHPHTLSSTKMAFLKQAAGLVLEIQEKKSYTDFPQCEQASSGVYWFKSGNIMKSAFTAMMNNKRNRETQSYNGEFYVTLAYNIMISAGYRVGYYETPQVAILGTPNEVRNFDAWRTIVKNQFLTSEEDVLRCYRYWKEYHR